MHKCRESIWSRNINHKKLDDLVILGIDPGSQITGYAVLKNSVDLLDWGIVKPNRKCSLHKRVFSVAESIEKLIDRFQPNIIAIENQFVGNIPYACIPIIQIKGAITFIAYKNKIEFREYCPTKCKKALTGNGRANKDLVMRSVGSIFKIDIQDLEHNCADAISVAFCCSSEHI